jgi:hypothetical protein
MLLRDEFHIVERRFGRLFNLPEIEVFSDKICVFEAFRGHKKKGTPIGADGADLGRLHPYNPWSCVPCLPRKIT